MDESTFLHHSPCPSCDSSDAFGVYDDGHGYCFSCSYRVKNVDQEGIETNTNIEGGDPVSNVISKGLREGHNITAVPERKLTFETCEKFGYFLDTTDDCYVATYRDSKGHPVAQKLRYKGKNFQIVGDISEATLFGQHLWKGEGRKVTVTEGEIDCMSVSQAQGNKWPVVSIPTGSAGAKKALKKQVEWLEGFDQIVLCFDQDEAGRKAVEKCAGLFTPSKVRVVTLPLKDPSEMLQKGRGKELMDCIWNASPYSPDGIVNAAELKDTLFHEPVVESISTPWEGVNNMTLGIRKAEITTIGAGSGVGKSQVCRELAYHLMVEEGQRIGYVALEESIKKTALTLIGLDLNKRIDIDRSGVSENDFNNSFEKFIDQDRLFLYDHFGSLGSHNLISKLRYLAIGCEVDFIILDHVSIVVSGMDLTEDERRTIDNLMTSLASLTQETGVGIILVSHMNQPSGTPLEEGGKTSLNLFRGSRSIGQLSFTAIGCERNQQCEDNPNRTTLRVLKSRHEGSTGVACKLDYDRHTGRMVEVMSVKGQQDY